MRDGSWRAQMGLGIFLLIFGLLLGAFPVRAAVVINEILADPASDWNGDGEIDTKLDEWVEVHNTGPDGVFLTHYWLRDSLDDTPHLNMFGYLEAGETAVFYGHHAVAWQLENGAGSSGLSLNNGGDTVVLLHTNEDDPDQLDVVDSHAYVSHTAEDDRSTGRHQEGEVWLLFDGLNIYDGTNEPLSTGCEPSPGAPNACPGGTPAEATSWSAVKGRFE